MIAVPLNRIANWISQWLVPQPLTGAADRVGAIAAMLIIALCAAWKSWLVLSGVIELTQSDGSSRLYYAISRYEETGGLWSSIGWTDLPLPVPQIYYVLLYKLDVATAGTVSVIKSVLLANIVLFAGASLVLAVIALRWMGSVAAVVSSLLISTAAMPAFVSTTEAVEPWALLWMSLALFAALESTRSTTPERWAYASGFALLLASFFRIEFALLALPLSALLYARIGFLRTFAVALISLSFLIAFNQIGPLLNAGAIQYSDLRTFYNVVPLSPSAFLKSLLYTRGMLETWAPNLVFWLALLSAAVGLCIRQARIFSVLALYAMAIVVLLAISGRVTSGQPRYAVHAIMLLALPLAYLIQAAVASAAALAPSPYSRMARFVTLGGILICLLPALVNVHTTMEARSRSPAEDFRQAKSFLVANLKQGERILADHTYWHGFYFALHAGAKTGTLSYSYLARCCVSERAREVLGAGRIELLTRWKSPVMGALDADTRYQAHQVYGQGFIERYRPRYLVVLAGDLLKRWQNRRDVPKDRSSIVLADMKPAPPVGLNGGYVVTPRYAAQSYCAVERFRTPSIVVLEAFYPANVEKVPPNDLCVAVTAARPGPRVIRSPARTQQG